jgi:hypothetical protein
VSANRNLKKETLIEPLGCDHELEYLVLSPFGTESIANLLWKQCKDRGKGTALTNHYGFIPKN